MFTRHWSRLIGPAIFALFSIAPSLAETRVGALRSAFAAASSTATFRVGLAEPTGATYQWFKNGAPISSSNSDAYSIPLVQVADAGGYHVLVSNPAGSATSLAAGLSVIVQPALVSLMPSDQTVPPGVNVTFRAAASGKHVNYQWNFNGAPLRRQNSNTLSLPRVDPQSAGVYTVTISNRAGPIAAATAILTVKASAGN